MITQYIVLVLTPVGGGARLHAGTFGPYDLKRARECAGQFIGAKVEIIEVERPAVVVEPSDIRLKR